MADISDEEAERIIARIRRYPPDLPYGDGRWHTPASKRPSTETVINIHGPRWPMVEAKDAQKTIDLVTAMTEGLPDGPLPANATNQK